MSWSERRLLACSATDLSPDRQSIDRSIIDGAHRFSVRCLTDLVVHECVSSHDKHWQHIDQTYTPTNNRRSSSADHARRPLARLSRRPHADLSSTILTRIRSTDLFFYRQGRSLGLASVSPFVTMAVHPVVQLCTVRLINMGVLLYQVPVRHSPRDWPNPYATTPISRDEFIFHQPSWKWSMLKSLAEAERLTNDDMHLSSFVKWIFSE